MSSVYIVYAVCPGFCTLFFTVPPDECRVYYLQIGYDYFLSNSYLLNIHDPSSLDIYLCSCRSVLIQTTDRSPICLISRGLLLLLHKILCVSSFLPVFLWLLGCYRQSSFYCIKRSVSTLFSRLAIISCTKQQQAMPSR